MFIGKAKAKKQSITKNVSGVNETAILELFNSLTDQEDQENLSISGIGKLCEQIGLDPQNDVRVLVLLWKLGAILKPGSISKDEFLKGMKALGSDSVVSLTKLIPSLDPGFLEKSKFREFYRFVFQFSREGTHKTLEKDLVCALLPVVLDSARAPHLESFLQFLESSNHQRITADQWDSFLQFQAAVDLDCGNYDDDGAWPLLLDEYVAWRRSKK